MPASFGSRGFIPVSYTHLYSVEAAKAKLFAAETAMAVTTEVVQLFGGYGYIREYDVAVSYTHLDVYKRQAADNGNLYPRVKAASAALSAGGGTFCDPLRGTASPSRAAEILQ